MKPAATNKPLMASVIHADKCVGFILRRFDGFQAFDRDEKNLGLFCEEHAALTAILNPKPADPSCPF